MSQAIEKFEIRVDDAELDDLKQRLERTRWPDQIPGSGWGYGTDLAYLQELCAYWREEFDWRAQEALLNRFEHYRTQIDGENLHFLHARSRVEAALPLVITPRLARLGLRVLQDHRAADGSRGARRKRPGCLPRRLPFDARLRLLGAHDAAGLGRAAGGGDRREADGAPGLRALRRPGRRLGGARRDAPGARRCGAPGGHPPQHGGSRAAPGVENPMEGLSPQELEGLAALGEFQQHETGYQQIQGTKPQTLGYGLTDSPAGLAGWIVEKFRSWSDCDGDVEKRFSKDELLANVMIYWVTRTINSSVRLYCESMRAGSFGLPPRKVEVPTGCAIFPKEMIRPPRSWAEAQFDVRRWSVMPSGGHFAALEEPEALVAEIRGFFRELR